MIVTIPYYYPDFVMRVYVDLAKEDPVLKDLEHLEKANGNLDICDIKALPGTPMVDATKVFAMVWRFFPTLDPQVSICRSKPLQLNLKDSVKFVVK